MFPRDATYAANDNGGEEFQKCQTVQPPFRETARGVLVRVEQHRLMPDGPAVLGPSFYPLDCFFGKSCGTVYGNQVVGADAARPCRALALFSLTEQFRYQPRDLVRHQFRLKQRKNTSNNVCPTDPLLMKARLVRGGNEPCAVRMKNAHDYL